LPISLGIIQTTPEHPHKLSDDPIVKDLLLVSGTAKLPLRQDRQFYSTREACQDPLDRAPSPPRVPPPRSHRPSRSAPASAHPRRAGHSRRLEGTVKTNVTMG
jgi:hypothetical protein